jgi:hypothetical protein
VNSTRVCVGKKWVTLVLWQYYAEKIEGARLLRTPPEKVGYVSNFDNTMLRISKVRDYCELHQKKWVTLVTLTILC